ncbi:hypothetical protein AB0G15_40360 [Streptosporangium sp. NPDC023825]|uniref:hypothetical protein n=1 Tax=Streptosporangium sp. NPDC023825 TaxID=3154909 RepID=UPI00343BF912
MALSAAITAFVPASFWTKALPRHPAAAVPVAGMAGAVSHRRRRRASGMSSACRSPAAPLTPFP